MNEIKNLGLFYDKKDKIKELDSLSVFTSLKRFNRIVLSILPPKSLKHIRIKNFKYTITKDGKTYNFECLSDKKILKGDKKILQNYKERLRKYFWRVLRIASSNKLIDSKLLVGYGNEIQLLVDYSKNGKRYIIDYLNNIIMEKENYIELYNFKVINEIDRFTLWQMHLILEELKFDPQMMLYFFIFSREILKDLSKSYKYLSSKYDEYGKNYSNYYWMGDACDRLYFMDEDYKFDKKETIKTKIRKFTENPEQTIEDIYPLGNGKYCYKDYFKKIEFKLISDYVTGNDDIKNELLSNNRYHQCHANSCIMLFRLDNEKKYWVSGQIKVNNYDYLYHSWVECTKNGKTYVFDYNYNLIMEKKDYYKLMDAKAINKSDIETIKKLKDYVLDGVLTSSCMTIGYFSQELLRDLEKQPILKK